MSARKQARELYYLINPYLDALKERGVLHMPVRSSFDPAESILDDQPKLIKPIPRIEFRFVKGTWATADGKRYSANRIEAEGIVVMAWMKVADAWEVILDQIGLPTNEAAPSDAPGRHGSDVWRSA